MTTGAQVDATEKVVQDPLTIQENLTRSSVPPFETVSVEEEDAPTGSGAPGIEGIQDGTIAEVAGAEAVS